MNKTIHHFILTLSSTLRAGADLIEHCLNEAAASPEAASVPPAPQEAAPEKKKPGRPSKKEAAPEQESQKQAEQKEEEPADLPTFATWEELKVFCRPIIEFGGQPFLKLKETIKAHGGSKLADLPSDSYPKFIAEVQAQLADLPKAGEEV